MKSGMTPITEERFLEELIVMQEKGILTLDGDMVIKNEKNTD